MPKDFDVKRPDTVLTDAFDAEELPPEPALELGQGFSKQVLLAAKERYDGRYDKQYNPGAKFAGTGLKFDTGKPRLDLIAPEFMMYIGQVLHYGVEKYDKVNKAYNWRYGMAWSRPLGAALRHIFQWMGGEKLDRESGLPHLAHAATNLMFLVSYEVTGVGEDDRWSGLSAPETTAAVPPPRTPQEP